MKWEYTTNYALSIPQTSRKKMKISQHHKAVRIQSDQILQGISRGSNSDHDDYGG